MRNKLKESVHGGKGVQVAETEKTGRKSREAPRLGAGKKRPVPKVKKRLEPW